MNIKFTVELKCSDGLDQAELQQELKTALETSFLFDMGVEDVKVELQEIS